MVREMKPSCSMLAIAAFIVALIIGLLWCPIAHAQSVSPAQMFGCNRSVQYDASTNGSTKLVTGTATQRVYVCGFTFFAAGTANVKLIYGTGGTCGAGTTAVTPAFQLTTQTGVVDKSPVYMGLLPVPVSNDLCLNTSAGVAVQAIVYYAQF